jgi:sugar phosphate isomerase/epimerase/outer membrane protein assembly factor BamB
MRAAFRGILLALCTGSALASNWPQFRGPNAAGISPDRDLPSELNNACWKTSVPPGNSSPCVWGNNIFLTGFAEKKRLIVFCIDRRDGRIRWEREVPADRIENVHPGAGSPASATPATDGERVYVFFGSVGVVCFDFEGRQVWKHALGPFTYTLGWGAASSPIVCGDSVILSCDNDGESFLLALDKRTGKEKWRTPRPNMRAGYATPVLWQTQIVAAGSGRVTAYDADTGKELWHAEQPKSFVATTPVASEQLLFAAGVDWSVAVSDFRRSATSQQKPNWNMLFENHDGNRDGKVSREEIPRMNPKAFDRIDTNHDGFLTREELDADFYRQQKEKQAEPPPATDTQTGNVLMAIRPGGDIAWREPGVAPYVPSPLLYENHLYVVKEGGFLSCFDSVTGKRLNRQRLAGGTYYASPVAGDGKIYVVSEKGEVTVLAAGPELRVLSRGSLGERCLATPAIAGGKLYVRTERNLLCFGNERVKLRGQPQARCMNIAISTASFGRPLREKKLDLLDFPAVCARAGLEEIELNDFCLKGDWTIIRELKQRAARHGLGICAVAVENNFYRATPAEIEKERAHLVEYLDIACFLGAPLLRVNTCPYGKNLPASIIPKGVTHEMAFDAAVKTFRSVMMLAQEKGVVLVLENHGGISRTSGDQLKLLKAVNSEWFRINLDTGNYYADPMAGTDPFENFLDATDRLAPFLAFCHAKIWDVTDDLREPTLDYDAFFARLRKHNYRGPVSIEYMGRKDVMEMLPKCVALMKRCRGVSRLKE